MFYLPGVDNGLTDLVPLQFINDGPTEIAEYIIQDWLMETYSHKEGFNTIRVKMILSRKILNVFLVTYLPTILMNMINQATNYFR